MNKAESLSPSAAKAASSSTPDHGREICGGGERHFSQYNTFKKKGKGIASWKVKGNGTKHLFGRAPTLDGRNKERKSLTYATNGGRSKALQKSFTLATGLSHDAVDDGKAPDNLGTAKVLQVLTRLKVTKTVTSQEGDTLRRAVLAGDQHTTRVLRQINTYGISGGTQTVLNDLLVEIRGSHEISPFHSKKVSSGVDIILIQGVLAKKRAFGFNVSRFFVLVSSELRYYDLDTGKKIQAGTLPLENAAPKGKYPYNKIFLVKDVAEGTAQCSFDLQVGDGKVLRLRAKNREEKQLWLVALAEWIVAEGQVSDKTKWGRDKSFMAISKVRDEEAEDHFEELRLTPDAQLEPIVVGNSARVKDSAFEKRVVKHVEISHKGNVKTLFESKVKFRAGETGLKTWETAILSVTKEAVLVHAVGKTYLDEDGGPESESLGDLIDTIPFSENLKLKSSNRHDYQFSIVTSKSSRKFRRGAYEFTATTAVNYRALLATLASAIKVIGEVNFKKKRSSIVMTEVGWNAREKRKSVFNTVARGTPSNSISTDDSDRKNIDLFAKPISIDEGTSDINRSSSLQRPASPADFLSTLGQETSKRRLKRTMTTADNAEKPMRTILSTKGRNDPTPVSMASKKRGKRHSVASLGTHRGPAMNFSRLKMLRLERSDQFDSISGNEEFDKLWESIYGTTLDQDDNVSFETKVLALPEARKTKSVAQENVLRKAIETVGSAASASSRVSATLFNQLDERGLTELVSEMVYIEVPPHSTVFKLGDPGELFYIVESGKFVLEEAESSTLARQQHIKKAIVVRGKRQSAVLSTSSRNDLHSWVIAGPGDCFGHEALFHDATRGMSVATKNNPGSLWAVSKNQFHVAVRKSAKRSKLLRRRIFQLIPSFHNYFKISEIKRLADSAEEEVVQAGKALLINASPTKAYIVLGGKAHVVEQHEDIQSKKEFDIGPGSIIGLSIVLQNDSAKKKLTVRATENKLHVMAISTVDVSDALGEDRFGAFQEHLLGLVRVKKPIRRATVQPRQLATFSDGLVAKTVSQDVNHLDDEPQKIAIIKDRRFSTMPLNSISSSGLISDFTEGRRGVMKSSPPGSGKGWKSARKHFRRRKGVTNNTSARIHRQSVLTKMKGTNFGNAETVSLNKVDPQSHGQVMLPDGGSAETGSFHEPTTAPVTKVESSPRSETTDITSLPSPLPSNAKSESSLCALPKVKAASSPTLPPHTKTIPASPPPPPPPPPQAKTTTTKTTSPPPPPLASQTKSKPPPSPPQLPAPPLTSTASVLQTSIGPLSSPTRPNEASPPRSSPPREAHFAGSSSPKMRTGSFLSSPGTQCAQSQTRISSPLTLPKTKSLGTLGRRSGMRKESSNWFGRLSSTFRKSQTSKNLDDKIEWASRPPSRSNSMNAIVTRKRPVSMHKIIRFESDSTDIAADAQTQSLLSEERTSVSPFDDDFSEEDMSEDNSSDEGDFDQEDIEWADGSYISPQISLTDLVVQKTLGHGAFSKVKLVSAKGNFYALKCMEKRYISENDCTHLVDNEVAALRELNGTSSFLVGLHGAFATEKMVYLLQELCSGGELYEYLHSRETEKFDEKSAVFYGACIVEGLAAMHSKKIIYRDLKLENLIIDDFGYVKLVDFGLAKKTNRTYTQCGTPEYMAPEMVLSAGHNCTVDWWALGILMFEMVTSSTPFCGGDAMETYENILDYKVSTTLNYGIDPETLSNGYRRAIKRFLRPKPSRRLGANGAAEVTSSFVFAKFQWPNLRKRDLTPPFIPGDDDDGGGASSLEQTGEDGGFSILDDPDFSGVTNDYSGWAPAL